MANEWDVVSQEPVATAPTRRPQQASAADDPWAPVATEPRMVNGIPRDIATDPDLQFDGATPLTDPYYSQPRTPAEAMSAPAAAPEIEARESPSILDALRNPLGTIANEIAYQRSRESPSESIDRTWTEALVTDPATQLRRGTRNVVGGLAGLPVEAMNLGAAITNPVEAVRRIAGGDPLVRQPDVVRGVQGILDEQNVTDAQENLSAKAQAQMGEIQGQDGFVDTLGYLAANPTAAANELVAQVPQFLQIVRGSKWGTIAMQSLSSGSQNAAQVYQTLVSEGADPEEADRVAQAASNLIALGTGALTALPGASSLERVLAGRAGRESGKDLSTQVIASLFGEPASEAGQETFEQVVQNVATGRPAGEGAGAAAAIGAAIGAPGGALAAGADVLANEPTQQPATPAAAMAGEWEPVATESAEQAEPAAQQQPTQDLTPRQPAAATLTGGESREQLVDEWRAAATPDERAAAAARIAAFDAQQRDAGAVRGGEVGAGDGGGVGSGQAAASAAGGAADVRADGSEPSMVDAQQPAGTGHAPDDGRLSGPPVAGGGSAAVDGAAAADGEAGAGAVPGELPAQDRGATAETDEEAGAPRLVRDTTSGRVEDGYADTNDPAITAALGSAARGITVHRAISDLRPEDQQRIGISDADTDVEGFYDPDTGRVHIFEDNLDVSGMGPNERKVWVAAHERSGHAGVRGMFADSAGSNAEGAGQLRATLRRAQQNETISAVVAAMEQQRPERGDILTEEAIVELAAAVRTGNYQHITDRYGVEVPPAARATLRGYIERLIQSIKRALGRAGDAFTDADIYRLIEDANRYAERGEVRGTSRRSEQRQGPVAQRSPGDPPRLVSMLVRARQKGPLSRSEKELLFSLGYITDRYRVDSRLALTEAGKRKLDDLRGESLRGDQRQGPVAQRSFHGTPHRNVDRFSTDKIGTGEGNQVYGWGLYFTGGRDIADGYRRGLSAIGRSTGGTIADRMLQDQGSPRAAMEVISRMRRGGVQAAERMLGEARWSTAGDPETARRRMEQELSGAERFLRADNNRGQLYQQEIPEDSELLDWDSSLESQPQNIQDAVNAAFDEAGKRRPPGFAAGHGAYEVLSRTLGSDRAASEALGRAGIPGLRYRSGQRSGIRDSQISNYVIWDESRIGQPEGLIASRANRLLRNLTPAEQKKVTDKVAAKIEAQLTKLPPKREMAAAAVAGRAKRGWYRQSAETISAVFGPDAPLFAGLLAATSPQISVEGNLKNALSIWRDWVAAGRPTERDDILSVMRSSLRRSFGNSLLAWENNTVRALQGQGILSGPKVDSFMRNLLGNVEEVTNDAWMANFSNVNQTIFKGALNVRGTDPGKGSGYLAMNARVRETARELTRLTGEEWTPAEVQETIWSWAKTITEMADSAGEIRTAEELVLDRAVTDELIASTPAFGDLFTMPEYRQILEEAGYGDQLNEVSAQRDAARQAGQEPGARGQAEPFAPEDQLRLERRAARRIDDFRRSRSEAAAVEEADADEVPFSRGEPGRFEPLPGAPKIKGATGPDKRLVRIAERYAKANDIDLRRQQAYVSADPDRGARIAEAYEAMEHAPQDPAVQAAYADLIRQTVAQYRALEDAGYKMWFVDPDNDPYGGNPWNAMRDLRANQSMGVFPTDAGFGSGATDIDVSDNPLMADTGIRWPYGAPDGELRPVLANDLFRAVHDAFGHGLEGAGFRADGEENAWQAHVRLFTGPAVGAITTETRGQNSWLNFGPYGESNRTAKVEDTVFADQKTGLMPEWTWTEGRADDEDFVASRSARTPAQRVQDAIKMSIDNADADAELLLRRYDRFRDKSIFGFDDKAMDRAMGRRGFINRTDDDDGRKVDLDTEHRVYGYMSSLPNPEPVASRGFSANPQVDTPEFRRWFGDSKVVDENGDPLVVYHGTTAEFDTFNRNAERRHSLVLPGIFFAPDRRYAERFSGQGGKVVSTYLRVENPVEIDMGQNVPAFDDFSEPAEWIDGSDDLVRARLEQAEADGHDGAIIRNWNDGSGPTQYVVFSPEQIKSATGNSGAFDPENPSIIASRGFSAKKRQPDAVSVDAFHYSTTPGLKSLDPKKAGTGSAGRERRRFGMGNFGQQGGTAARVAFYVSEDGTPPAPESMVTGEHLYRTQLDNLYDLDEDPRGFVEDAGMNQDALEEEISDAGFDGFLAPAQPGIDVPTAVVFDIGNKKVPVQPYEDGPVASRRDPQIDTPEFKRWAQGAELVGPEHEFVDGEPVIVEGYHGTGDSFDVFDNAMARPGRGRNTRGASWFSSSPEVASGFAEYQDGSTVGGVTIGNSQVYKVYLRLTKPYIDHDGTYARGGGLRRDIIRDFQFDGYDGIIWPNSHFDLPDTTMDGPVTGYRRNRFGEVFGDDVDYPHQYAVFSPNQIKSATGNSGAFDNDNPSIIANRRTPYDARSDRNQLFGRLAAAGYQQGNATQPQQASGGRFVRLQYAADNVRTALQDKMLPLLRAQESVSTNGPAVTSITLDDAMNAYRMENLMHGAVKNGIDRVHQRYLQPIQDAIRKSPFTLPQFEDFLYATAAPERNTEIAKINRAMPDGGSGITTQTARDILAGRAPGAISGTTLTPEAIKLFKSLEPLVRKMRDEVLDNMVDAGQITPELAAALRAKYPNYIPMRGKDGELDEQRGGSGRGISQRAGTGLRRALGRGDSNIPQNIMGELVGDLQRSIAGKEKAKVARAFLRFALANPQPDLYTVEPVDLEWKFSEATGEAYLGVKRRGEDVDSTMIVMHEGNPVYVRVIDPALRDAVLNMSANDMAAHIKWLGWLNRWRSAVLTRYNPAFTPVNMFRDLQFGLVAIAAEQGAGAAARVAKLYAGAFRASYRHASQQRGDASKPNAQKNMDDWAAEFYGAGASTGITMVDDVVNLQRKLVAATQSIAQLAAQGRALSVTARTIKPLVDVIENVNEASENAIRLAAYVEQRRRGIGKERAAEYAKNVTINFNRKGSAGSVLNAIFLFYNAAMQGSHAVIRVMRNRKVQAYLAGMASLQGLLAATMMGDDDDDGITEWDKIPDYVKRTSLVIPLGGDDYFAMPMPYGFNFFTYLGGRGTQRMMLGDRPTDSNIAVDMLKSVTEAFSPIPFQDGYRSLFGDQIGFMMGLAANTNDFGSPIAKKDPFPAYDEPAAINGKVTTPRAYHVAAQLLAKLGGADLDERIPPVGYLDVAPEQLEAITEYFGGGLANLVNRGASWGEQLNAGNLEGGMDTLSKLPIASRMIGRLNESRAIADRYYSERGEFARHRDIVNARLDAGASLEEATGDRPPEYVQGLQQARYKRSGRRDDRSRYRKGQPRTDAAGRPVVSEEEGSTTQVAKDVEKRVKSLNSAIKDIRAGTMTNEQVATMYDSHYRVGVATVGESALDGITGAASDIGLPEGFDAEATAPARVRNRAIKLLQDIRAEEERRLLRTLQWARKE